MYTVLFNFVPLLYLQGAQDKEQGSCLFNTLTVWMQMQYVLIQNT